MVRPGQQALQGLLEPTNFRKLYRKHKPFYNYMEYKDVSSCFATIKITKTSCCWIGFEQYLTNAAIKAAAWVAIVLFEFEQRLRLQCIHRNKALR